MWNMIISNICLEMEVVDKKFAEQGLSYLDCKSATMFYTTGPPQKNNASGAGAASAAPAPAPAPVPTNSLGWGAASIATSRLPSAFTVAAAQPQQSEHPTSLQDLEARHSQVPKQWRKFHRLVWSVAQKSKRINSRLFYLIFSS
jgi:hypothetical protein